MTYFLTHQARCFCEFRDGGRGKNGVMCELNGIFVQRSVCNYYDFCTGPTTIKEAVVIGDAPESLCGEGK